MASINAEPPEMASSAPGAYAKLSAVENESES